MEKPHHHFLYKSLLASQIYIQIVFAVKGRLNLISEKYREELHKYTTGIITNRGQKLLAIYFMPNHAHILINLKPNIAISDLVRDIKSGTSGFINANKWMPGKFQWQEGYGAFSYSHRQVDTIINYILTQEEHHKKKSFKDEYISVLNDFNIQYDDQYLFDWVD